MQRFEIHSRRGSFALGLAGIVDALCALAMLMYYVVRSWDTASALDRLLQLSLIVSAAGGLYLLIVGLENLGVLRLRRASAATSS